MRKIKLIAFLLSVTSCLLLFSVGFASWYNLSIPDENRSGLFEAYQVKKMDSYISLSKTNGFQLFEFTALGFKDGKNKITATYDLNKTEIEAFDLEDDVTIESTLSYKNLLDANKKLFALTGDNKITVQISYTIDGQMTTETLTPKEGDGSAITVNYTFNTLPSQFSIIYTFDIEQDFRANFGKYISFLEDNKTEFTTTARITNFSQ